MKRLHFRHLFVALGLLVIAVALSPAGYCQTPDKVSPCQLKNNPAAYNRKLVEVTGFVSHGFEDFGLFDPTCPSWPYVWLEYGGTIKSGTIYCCGVTNSRSRPSELEVEKIPIPLVNDVSFRDFDSLIQQTPDSVVHATIVGRFFAGQQSHSPGGTFWGGYGHMGCCSLLAIQQVLSVDPHDANDLDYRASADQPNITKVGCGIRDLVSIWPYGESMEAQKLAESGERNWAFDNPERVASDSLATLLKIDQSSIQAMKQTRETQSRVVYEWNPPGKKASYMIVVSRPYWLSFYSSKPRRVAWVVIAAWESSCGRGNSVVRVR